VWKIGETVDTPHAKKAWWQREPITKSARVFPVP